MYGPPYTSAHRYGSKYASKRFKAASLPALIVLAMAVMRVLTCVRSLSRKSPPNVPLLVSENKTSFVISLKRTSSSSLAPRIWTERISTSESAATFIYPAFSEQRIPPADRRQHGFSRPNQRPASLYALPGGSPPNPKTPPAPIQAPGRGAAFCPLMVLK